MSKEKREARKKRLEEIGATMWKPFLIMIAVFVIIGLGFWIFTMVRNFRADLFEEQLAKMQSVTLIGKGETLKDAVFAADVKAMENFGDCYQVSFEEISSDPWEVKVTYRRIGTD
jgi:hypothetical protein